MSLDHVQDRRHEHRAPAQLAARVFRNGRPTTYPVVEWSANGARLLTPVGDELPMVFWVEFDLPDGGLRRERARTMWCDGPTSGIRFDVPDDLASLFAADGLDALPSEA